MSGALADFVEKEIVFKIHCTICNDREDHEFNVTKREALKRFAASGWTSLATDVACPCCASRLN